MSIGVRMMHSPHQKRKKKKIKIKEHINDKNITYIGGRTAASWDASAKASIVSCEEGKALVVDEDEDDEEEGEEEQEDDEEFR